MAPEKKSAKRRPASFFPHQPKTIKVGQKAPTWPQAQTNMGTQIGLAAQVMRSGPFTGVRIHSHPLFQIITEMKVPNYENHREARLLGTHLRLPTGQRPSLWPHDLQGQVAATWSGAQIRHSVWPATFSRGFSSHHCPRQYWNVLGPSPQPAFDPTQNAFPTGFLKTLSLFLTVLNHCTSNICSW